MKKALGLIFLFLFIGAVGYGIYFLYNKNQEPDSFYETKQAEVADIVKKTVATGSVVPRKEILIKPVVSGIIHEVYVEAGDRIKKGEVIAKVKIIPDMVNLSNAQNRLDRAQISLENSKIEYDRNKKLLDQEVISAADFQPFQLSYNNAKIELSSAEDNLQIIKEGVSKSASTTSNTLVRSTINGMVLDVPVKEGNQVIESNTFNEGTTIATVADMSDLIFEGDLDESEVGKVKEGMEIQLTIGALQDKRITAQLEYISPKGVEKDGAIQFLIKAAVQVNDSAFIRAGYSANAAIVLDKREKVLAINESLVEFEKSNAFVYVESSPQVFDKREIKLGLSDGIKAEILSGLTEQEKVRGKKKESKK